MPVKYEGNSLTEIEENSDETLMEFPCSFPIKAMGEVADDFDSLIVSIIRKHVDDLSEGAVKTRSSRGGRYLSVTVVVEAKSKQQLDNIYMDLTAHERVIMAL